MPDNIPLSGMNFLQMQNSLQNFIEIFDLNFKNSKLSKNLNIIYTDEYEALAASVFHHLKSSFNVSIQKIHTIFDDNLEKAILEKDVFLLFYTMPWNELKKYYVTVRPLLKRYHDRSYIVRDCLNDFEHIYATPFSEINRINSGLIQLGANTKKVVIKNALGTELEFLFEQHSPWRNIDGTNIPNEIVPSEVSNYTSLVNGRVVFTGTLLSLVPIGKKYGQIKDPITLHIENGFIKNISCSNADLQSDLLKIYDYCEGNREIVELGIGTNSGVQTKGMSAPFEERKAGFHLGTGGYQPKSQHIDFIFDDSEIYFDGNCVFSNNQFHI